MTALAATRSRLFDWTRRRRAAQLAARRPKAAERSEHPLPVIRLPAPEGRWTVRLGDAQGRLLGRYTDAGGFTPNPIDGRLRAVPPPVGGDLHGRWAKVKAEIAAQLT